MTETTETTCTKKKMTWCRKITAYGTMGKVNRNYYDPIYAGGFAHFKSVGTVNLTAIECHRLVRWLNDELEVPVNFDAFPVSEQDDIDDHRNALPDTRLEAEDWTICGHGNSCRKISKPNLALIAVAISAFTTGIKI